MNSLGEIVKIVDPYSMYFPFFFGNEFFLTTLKGSFWDLKYLNWDPRRTIVVDYDQMSYLNKNNNIVKIE